MGASIRTEKDILTKLPRLKSVVLVQWVCSATWRLTFNNLDRMLPFACEFQCRTKPEFLRVPQAPNVKRLGQILGRLLDYIVDHMWETQDPLAKNIQSMPHTRVTRPASSDNAWRGSRDPKARTNNHRRPSRWTASSIFTIQTPRWEHSFPGNELAVAVIEHLPFNFLC
mgnify:CR=1 FL=1